MTRDLFNLMIRASCGDVSREIDIGEHGYSTLDYTVARVQMMMLCDAIMLPIPTLYF